MKPKIQDVQKFYDQETDRYIKDRYAGNRCEHFAYQSRKELVVEILSSLEGSILDVGCGPAIYSSDLITHGFSTVSIDLSFQMIKTAREITGPSGKSALWINSEIENLPFKNSSFDNVLAIGVIAYSSKADNAIKELSRVIKPNGSLIIQCSNSLCPTSNLIGFKDFLLTKIGLRKKRHNLDLITSSYGKFKNLLAVHDLRVLKKRNYDFRLPFAEKFFPKTSVSIMKKSHYLLNDSKTFGWLGEGYIVHAQKSNQ